VPSLISHSVVAVAAGVAFAPRDVPTQFWTLAILCSILPDADVIGFPFGIPYHHFFGRRGFFHSPFFGLLWSFFIVSIFFREADIFSARTPIEVSPIGAKAFFSKWGLAVMKNELQWIWLPSFMVVVLSTLIRGLAARH